MSFSDMVRERYLRSYGWHKVSQHVARRRPQKAYRTAEKYGFSEEDIRVEARRIYEEQFAEVWPKSAAQFALEFDLDKGWAQEKAREEIERLLVAGSGEKTAKRIGDYMESFNLSPDDVPVDYISEGHRYLHLPSNTAEEELAEKIVKKRRRPKLDGPQYGFADPGLVREQVVENALEKKVGSLQTELGEFENGPERDIFRRLGVEWVDDERLESYIDSF